MANLYTQGRARLLLAMGYTKTHPMDESAWRRGWNDAKAGIVDWRFAVLGFAGSPILGVFTEPLWGGLSAIGGLLLMWIGATATAPLRQRDEAREIASLGAASPEISALRALVGLRKMGTTQRNKWMTPVPSERWSEIAEEYGDWHGAVKLEMAKLDELAADIWETLDTYVPVWVVGENISPKMQGGQLKIVNEWTEKLERLLPFIERARQ